MDVQLVLLVKVVSDILDLVLVDVEPVERGWKEEVVKLLDLVVRDIQPTEGRQIVEESDNI